MAGCETGAAAGCWGGGVEGGVGLDLESADCGVLIGELAGVLQVGVRVDTRSSKVVDAPCMDAPPGTLILVFGAGEDVREVLREAVCTLGRSEIKRPAAEGGSLDDFVDVGSCRASGWSESANVFARAGSGWGRLLPAMYSSSSFFLYAPAVLP